MGNKHPHKKPKPQKQSKHLETYVTSINNKIDIGFLGEESAGKTSIIHSILNLEFNEDMVLTIGVEKMEKRYEINQDASKRHSRGVLRDFPEFPESKRLIFWDTPGQVRFRHSCMKAMKNFHGIMIVFDLTKKNTFENLDNWIKEIKNKLTHNPVLVLLGNKADYNKESWEVNDEEIKEFTEKNNLAYFEVSAKTKKGIDDALKYIVDKIIQKYED